MNDEEIIKYCRKMIMQNLNSQNADYTSEVLAILSSDKILLQHCYGVKELMTKCIEILENRGIWLDDE